jgi:hypothetical protein
MPPTHLEPTLSERESRILLREPKFKDPLGSESD